MYLWSIFQGCAIVAGKKNLLLQKSRCETIAVYIFTALLRIFCCIGKENLK